jgi:LCP family protein required for cell wall assembly
MGVSADQSWGPTVSGGGRRVARRVPKILLVVLLVFLLLLGGLAVWLNAQIPREDVDGLARGGSPMHVLVVGTDSREDLTREEQMELGVGGTGGERADTIFVMSIRRGDVALLAFPRDLWVQRCDGSTGRINVAIEAGATCMVETVRDVSGLEINHFMRVTFGGFVELVEAVGGVEMCLEEAISDRDAHIDLPAGCQTLEGTDALGYVRVRKIDDDLQRIQRQQQFVQALAREVASPATLFNPLRLYRLGDEAGGAVSLDDRIGPIGLARLAWGGRGMAGGNAVTHTVPGTPASRGGAAVLDIDEAEAQDLFSRFRDGRVFDEIAAGVTPEEVRVTVLNGAGVSGLAGQVGELLESRGFEVADIGNTDERDRTLVQHPPGDQQAAELVAADVPGDTDLEESPEVTHVTVLLGRSAGGG